MLSPTPSPLQVAELMQTKISSVHLWGPAKDRALEDEGLVVDHGLLDDSILYLTLDAEAVDK